MWNALKSLLFRKSASVEEDDVNETVEPTEITAEIGATHLSPKRTLCFKFHNFAQLQQRRVRCPPLPYNGYMWELLLYPAGTTKAKAGYMSVFLRRLDEVDHDSVDIGVEFTFRCGPSPETRRVTLGDFQKGRGQHHFAKLSDVLDPAKGFLVDGTLIVKVDIQFLINKPSEIWSPMGTLKKDMLNFFKRTDLADVTFLVAGVKIQAHKSVLMMRAPTLAALTEGVPENTDIPVENVQSHIFRAFLEFIYSDEISDDIYSIEDTMDLLDTADKFECLTLKLQVEAELAELHVDVDSVVDLLLYADSRNCALLRETAVDFIVANSDEVMDSDGFALLDESPKILKELMRAIAKPKAYNEREDSVEGMRVASLRRKLDEAGLDVDGTREMLVKRLKRSYDCRF